MVVAFIRHGEPRKGESDPELTSAGRRMASEAAQWLAGQGEAPHTIVATPTCRTRQTAEELQRVFPDAAFLQRQDCPESAADWQRLVAAVGPGPVAVVGHHPTLAFLLAAFGPPPIPVPIRHHAAALVLRPDTAGYWKIQAAWPGRAPL